MYLILRKNAVSLLYDFQLPSLGLIIWSSLLLMVNHIKVGHIFFVNEKKYQKLWEDASKSFLKLIKGKKKLKLFWRYKRNTFFVDKNRGSRLVKACVTYDSCIHRVLKALQYAIAKITLAIPYPNSELCGTEYSGLHAPSVFHYQI